MVWSCLESQDFLLLVIKPDDLSVSVCEGQRRRSDLRDNKKFKVKVRGPEATPSK